MVLCEMSVFRRGAIVVFVLPGCYAAQVGSWLQTFREDL